MVEVIERVKIVVEVVEGLKYQRIYDINTDGSFDGVNEAVAGIVAEAFAHCPLTVKSFYWLYVK